MNAIALIDSGNDRTSCPDAGAKRHARTECAVSFDEAPASPLAQIGVRSSFVGCDKRRGRLLRRTPSRLSQPCPACCLRSGACSRAEAKGGGAPTGMSATAAVAGKPIYTPPRLRRRRPNAVPMPSHANSPPIDRRRQL